MAPVELTPLGNGVHEIPQGDRDGHPMHVPGRLVATGPILEHVQDDAALGQLANVATLPGIVGAAWAMPDIHHGYGFPIGGVAAFDEDGVVSPGGVGFDINCGVRLLRTGLREEDVRPKLVQTMDALFGSVPAGMGGRGKSGVRDDDLRRILQDGATWATEEGILQDDEQRHLEAHGVVPDAEPKHVSDRARIRGVRGLGSLGSGNHFCELQVVSDVHENRAAASYGVAAGDVVLMIHTGSRGLGHQVCQDHVQALQSGAAELVDRQLACAKLGTPEADRYLGAMAAAANYAYVNRSIVADRARETLTRMFPHADVSAIYDVCHNIAKWEDHDLEGKRRRVLVHRKGATRAFGPGHPELAPQYQEVGQPVIVPGDMGRKSFLLAGTGTGPSAPPEDRRPFASCCHGAGRRMSRTAAKKQFQGESLIEELAKQGIIVRATSKQVAAEEAPLAYKDVSDVVASVEVAGLARQVATLKPLGVVKG